MERCRSVLCFLLALVCIWEFSRPHVEAAPLGLANVIARTVLKVAIEEGFEMGVAAWKRRRTPDNGLNFAMNVNLGTPPMQHNFTMALNSEFFWAACSPCIDCNQWVPRLAYIMLLTAPGNKSLRMSLGCGRQSTRLLGILSTSGLVGFAKTNKSFIGQLAEMDYTGKFIYCAPSDTFSGKIVFGNYKISSNSSLSYTPMIVNPISTALYYIGLRSISINDMLTFLVQGILADGTGGTIIDSTFAFSYFTPDSYTPLVQAIQNLNSNLTKVSSNKTAALLGNDICYNVSVNGDTPPPQTLTYHFENGTQVEFRTWFLLDDDAENATVCLAVGDSQKVGFSLNVIGTYQQLDVAVEFDLEKQEIGFGTAGCNVSMNLDTSSGFTYIFVWKSSTTQMFSFLPLLTYLLLV
ncbi:hypothetical protein SELMODRAFT_413680 [Selaginella moellendorffii]|uniref:Peptidase A1 domain-containing protein n=1 Tax=Selaginella moellendorffii TaxID=88036 RepID=D8RPV8_SELML|nr:hypothetical protein SELMODRAFT_413680 [Selaginella moellendorffii]